MIFAANCVSFVPVPSARDVNSIPAALFGQPIRFRRVPSVHRSGSSWRVPSAPTAVGSRLTSHTRRSRIISPADGAAVGHPAQIIITPDLVDLNWPESNWQSTEGRFSIDGFIENFGQLFSNDISVGPLLPERKFCQICTGRYIGSNPRPALCGTEGAHTKVRSADNSDWFNERSLAERIWMSLLMR